MKTKLYLAVAWLALTTAAFAVPTPMLHTDTPPCDPLFIPQVVDELGLSPPFPIDERLDAVATFTQQSACLPDDPLLPNALVLITNLTVPPRTFTNVWYVADRETSLSNPDGVAGMPGVPPELAFRIDSIGVNTPLIFESIAFDGVWVPGETWHFIIQDYTNILGLGPAVIDSIGVPSTASPPSSGSIIAIPEPATLSLLGLSGLMLLRRNRRVRGRNA